MSDADFLKGWLRGPRPRLSKYSLESGPQVVGAGRGCALRLAGQDRTLRKRGSRVAGAWGAPDTSVESRPFNLGPQWQYLQLRALGRAEQNPRWVHRAGKEGAWRQETRGGFRQ